MIVVNAFESIEASSPSYNVDVDARLFVGFQGDKPILTYESPHIEKVQIELTQLQALELASKLRSMVCSLRAREVH